MAVKIDRSRYDTKTLSMLDTFGAYFIDRYFNYIYLLSCDAVAEGRGKNITDSYRSNVINYMNGIAKKEYYVTAVKQIHAFYQEKSGFSSIVLSEFENRVLCAFIPAEYYRSFTNEQKDKVLRDIIVKTANELGTVVLGRSILPKIIDEHVNNPMLINHLQDITLDILLVQRETYFISFAKSVSDANAGDKVSRHVVDKVKQALVDEQRLRITMETDRDRAIAIARSLATSMQTMEKELISARQQIAELTATLTSLKTSQATQNIQNTQRVSPPRTNPSTQLTPTVKPTVTPVTTVAPTQITTQITTPQRDLSQQSADDSEDDSDTRSKQQEMIRNKFTQFADHSTSIIDVDDLGDDSGTWL